jgi:hypothetical protein
MEIDRVGMGWLPDYPDIRDYTFQSRELMAKKEIHSLVSPTGLGGAERSDVRLKPRKCVAGPWLGPPRSSCKAQDSEHFSSIYQPVSWLPP